MPRTSRRPAWSAQLGGCSVVWVGTPSLTSQGSLSDVVGKEVATFDVPVTAAVQGFAVAGDQPAKSAAERYRTMASPGYTLDERAAQYNAQAAVADNGVTWKITASGTQSPQLDAARIRGALAGRTPSEARAVLEAQGLNVTDLRLSPPWWQRMPLLRRADRGQLTCAILRSTLATAGSVSRSGMTRSASRARFRPSADRAASPRTSTVSPRSRAARRSGHS